MCCTFVLFQYVFANVSFARIDFARVVFADLICCSEIMFLFYLQRRPRTSRTLTLVIHASLWHEQQGVSSGCASDSKKKHKKELQVLALPLRNLTYILKIAWIWKEIHLPNHHVLGYLHMYIYIWYIYIYIYGNPPPQGLPRKEGNVSLTKCGVECIQRHAQKTL